MGPRKTCAGRLTNHLPKDSLGEATKARAQYFRASFCVDGPLPAPHAFQKACFNLHAAGRFRAKSRQLNDDVASPDDLGENPEQEMRSKL